MFTFVYILIGAPIVPLSIFEHKLTDESNYLKVHVTIHGHQVAFVFHTPLQLAHDGFFQ